MELSLFFARYLGIILILFSAALLINQRFYNNLWQDFVKQPLFLLFAGGLDLFLGLAVVLLHNLWVADWRVLITLLGWFILIRGAFRILLPETALSLITKVLRYPRVPIINIVLFLLLLLGVYLTFKSFHA